VTTLRIWYCALLVSGFVCICIGFLAKPSPGYMVTPLTGVWEFWYSDLMFTFDGMGGWGLNEQCSARSEF
jgi:hypothetical protein